MRNMRTQLMTAAAVAAAAAGGAAIANAASSTTSSGSSSLTPNVQAPVGGPPQGGFARGRHSCNGKTERPLSGETAAKVQKAALAKVSGTVERVETNVDSSAPYEAHIRTSDGSEATVEVNSDDTVHGVETIGGHP